MCLSEFQGVKGAFQPFVTLHHIINQRHSWISLYIFLAEISVLSTESYLCANIENKNKGKRRWKSEGYDFCDWRIMFIRFSCRTTWHPIIVRIGRYSCTTWKYIVVRHETIITHYYHFLMRKVIKWESFLCWNPFLERYID